MGLAAAQTRCTLRAPRVAVLTLAAPQDSTVSVKDEVVAQPEPPGQGAPPSPRAPAREERNGRPARLQADDPLPDEVEILPRPEALDDRCTVAPFTGGTEAGRSDTSHDETEVARLAAVAEDMDRDSAELGVEGWDS